jgi:hypothetical protein
MKKMSGSAVSYLGYVCVLLGFVLLGLFVVTLAVRSPYAPLIGGVAVVVFAVAVAGFRIGHRRRGSLWTQASTAAEKERYEVQYRARPASPRHQARPHRRPVPLLHGRYRAFGHALRVPRPHIRRAH